MYPLMHVCMYVCMYVCIHVCKRVWVGVHEWTNVYVCMYVCMYMCLSVAGHELRYVLIPCVAYSVMVSRMTDLSHGPHALTLISSISLFLSLSSEVTPNSLSSSIFSHSLLRPPFLTLLITLFVLFIYSDE